MFRPNIKLLFQNPKNQKSRSSIVIFESSLFMSWRFFIFIFACFFFFQAKTLKADESLAQDYAAQPPNLREFCRREIAGYYLKLYDLFLYNSRMQQHLKEQAVDLEKAIAVNQTLINKKKQELAQVIFDETLRGELDTVSSKQEALVSSLKQNKEQSTKLEVELKIQEKLAESFWNSIKSVFVKKPITGKGAGYKFYIAYIESCPAYRYGCPLSSSSAALLKQISFLEEKNWTLPSSCQKYADYLQKTH